ncbi:MAG: molybdenum cofactor guanylyltransferase [Kangiellaceae bacterium]|nr:molybdenum cofactor guanylyltransferase [Kangiellaceae bacterium]MCW9000121.1 molybdenum cofactor guanylyltransferase [Kangiellaceae bacterium]
MIEIRNITGLLLAGGRGSRVGGQDKGLLEIDGKSLAEQQTEWLSNQLSECFISANRNIEFYSSLGYSVLMDPQQNFSGPLIGVLKALEQCQTDWLFILPIDVPRLPVNLISELAQHVSGQGKGYYLATNVREHYLTMLISKNALPQLIKFCSGENSRVRDFLQMINAQSIDLGIAEARFANLNSPGDF